MLTILSIAWLVFWGYWLISAVTSYAPVQRRESHVSRLLYGIFVILSMLILFWAQSNSAYRFVPDTTAVKVVGIFITFLGLGFAVWARVHLGKYWSGNVTIKVEHKLIRTGPYRWVRNPIYTGIIIAVIGSTIADGELLALLAIVLIVIGFLVKIRMEEKFLLEEFGEIFYICYPFVGGLKFVIVIKNCTGRFTVD